VNCLATFIHSLVGTSKTPNAKRTLSNPLMRFRESIEGDGKDDNDPDNDLLDIGRHIH
jgi:hypothetical protein